MFVYYCTWILANLLSILFFPAKVYGRQNVPKSGGFIIACNHISNIDPPLIGIICPRVISFMAKRARGLMVRYAIEHRLKRPEALKKFSVDGYQFIAAASDEKQWMFRRGQERA